MFPIYFDPVFKKAEDITPSRNEPIRCQKLLDITPDFLVAKTPIPVVSSTPQERSLSLPNQPQLESTISSQNSSSNILREHDLNIIRTRLEAEFSDSPIVSERRLVTLNGETNVETRVRKPYESAIRVKQDMVCIPIKERRLSKADLAKAETLKCNCKEYCCMSFKETDILERRQHIFSMNQKDRKEFFIRDLLKNGARSEDTFDFKYFLKNKQVRIISQ